LGTTCKNGSQNSNLQGSNNPQDLYTDLTVRAFFPAGALADFLVVKVFWYRDGQLISEYNGCVPIESKSQTWWDTSSPLIMGFWNRTHCLYPGHASIRYYVYLKNGFSNQTIKTACGTMDIVHSTNNILDITTWNGPSIACSLPAYPGQESTE